jgi:hypothetical protein
MPTSRARHPIIETEQVARALDDAARYWPSEQGRAAAIEESHGAFPGMYGENYLEDLRRDWSA